MSACRLSGHVFCDAGAGIGREAAPPGARRAPRERNRSGPRSSRLAPSRRPEAARVRPDGAARPLVGPAPARVPGVLDVRGLLDLARVRGGALRQRSLSLAVLLAAPVRRAHARLAPRLVRREAGLVAD